jgi:RHS repeat-associated protein
MDGVTRLTYMQQRYYDQSIGRFLSVDPVTANAKTGANFNRYWYANNNPYKFIDPDGREAACVTLRVNCFNSGGTFEEKAKALAGLAVLTVGSLFGPSGVAAIFEKPATAVSAINQVAEIGAGDALGGATLTASVTTAAKISHLFDHKKHGLDALVEASGGSRENAFAALQKAADQALADGQLKTGPNGILPGGEDGVVLKVNGVLVQLVGGRVQGNTVHIGSASRQFIKDERN